MCACAYYLQEIDHISIFLSFPGEVKKRDMIVTIPSKHFMPQNRLFLRDDQRSYRKNAKTIIKLRTLVPANQKVANGHA